MSKRGITNYLEVIVSDVDYDIDGVDANIDEMITTLKLDAETIHFDTAVGDVPMQKEPVYDEELGEEDNDGEKEVMPKMTWVGVGLDEIADNAMRVKVEALKGKTKHSYMFDRRTGTTDKIKDSKLNMNRKRTGNGKEIWQCEAVSTKDGNQSSTTLPLVPVPIP